jgi:putative transposase
MPSRNTVREDLPDSYYHVYDRGANKQTIFKQSSDFKYFISLLARYLSSTESTNAHGYQYPNFADSVELNAYCLMGNHFHLLFYQVEQGALSRLMKSLQTSYSMYFNRKYGHKGAVFESKYKSSRIFDQSYLEHISRYIHMNPEKWKAYKYSSLDQYLNKNNLDWVKPDKVLELFEEADYQSFLEDYQKRKEALEDIKHILADH